MDSFTKESATLKVLIFLAFALRIFLMPISAHSDLFFINYYPNRFIESGQIVMTEDNVSYYPPLTFYTFAFFQYFDNLFSKTFSTWMNNLYFLSVNGFQGQAADYIKEVENPHIFRDIFLAKFPYLLFDVAIIFLLLRFAKERLVSKNMIIFWLFNPVLLYAIYIFGQFEIIPTFFVFLGFYVLRKNKTFAFFLLGIAAAYKNYAFLFIIPTIFIYGQSWSQKLKLLAISIAPYLIFLAPTLVTSSKEAIFSMAPKVYLHYRKPLEGWALYSQVIKYIILTTSYFTVLLFAFFLKVKDQWRASLGLSLVSILLVFALAPRISFHYLLWAAPLIIFWFRKAKVSAFILLAQALSLASYKLLANHLQAGLFAPLNPTFFSNVPTINDLLNQIIPYRIISTIGFAIFFVFNLYIIVSVLRRIVFQSEIIKVQKR